MQQDPDNQRNLLLAAALSIMVLAGWQYFYVGPRTPAPQAPKVATATQPGAPGTPAQPGVTPAPGASPAVNGAAAAAPVLTRDSALKLTPRVAIDTPALKGSLNLRGGFIDDLALAKYRDTLDPKSPNVLLLSPNGGPAPYFAEFGWLPAPGVNAVMPTADTTWTLASSGPLTPTTPAVLTYDNGQGLAFKRTISVDDKFMFKVLDEVANTSGRDVALVPYGRIYRFGTPKVEGWAILHEGLIGYIGEELLQEVTYADLGKEAETNLKSKNLAEGAKTFKPAKGGWLGFTDKYWSAALVPPQNQPYDARFAAIAKTAGRSELYYVNYQLQPIAVPAGQSIRTEAQMFGGAKEVKTINAYEASHGIAEFGKMVDWGWFHFITKPLFKLIDWLYGLLGNFGLAILATTVLVKAAFFPLQNKSYESMARMKKLQPDMEKVREDFKDDKAKQQQALMELYKKHKINPAAGCLPVLLQIPVFFALYKVLFVTIDMRHAPFYGWIKDLSAPDPTSIFNLFGLLPFTVPDYFLVGVWPLIMGATMWFQMQLNPQQPDPLQQKIFNWMPVMFTFMLASFPAGLVIYWAWSNVLSLAQQYYITKKSGAEIHLWKNLGIDKWLKKT